MNEELVQQKSFPYQQVIPILARRFRLSQQHCVGGPVGDHRFYPEPDCGTTCVAQLQTPWTAADYRGVMSQCLGS